MHGISGTKPGGHGRRSRTRSQAETRQLLGHEAARPGRRICFGYFLTVGLAEPGQAAFQHGPDRISSPNNSLVPQLAPSASSSKLENRSTLLHGNTLLWFHCPFTLSWPSNRQLELIQLFEVPPSVCANCSYIWGFCFFCPQRRVEVICPDPSGYEYQRSFFSWSSDVLAHYRGTTSHCTVPDVWLRALLPTDKQEMI